MGYDSERDDGKPDGAARIREVAAAYAAADLQLEAERLAELGTLPEADLRRQFMELLELGVYTIPTHAEEWKAFEKQDRELIAFESNAMRAARIWRAFPG